MAAIDPKTLRALRGLSPSSAQLALDLARVAACGIMSELEAVGLSYPEAVVVLQRALIFALGGTEYAALTNPAPSQQRLSPHDAAVMVEEVMQEKHGRVARV